nr:MFS transporter [Bacillus subtilis]
MWLANFFVSASTTMIVPFLSLYIETLSSFSNGFVQRWSGYVFGITFLMAFLVSPFWGRFGDKRGYKKILMATGTGIALSIFFMGFVTSVYQLFFLRMAMGLVTGFIPTSLAMISAQTPKSSAGKTLGTQRKWGKCPEACSTRFWEACLLIVSALRIPFLSHPL